MIKLLDHFILFNDDMLVMKYSEILLHGFRMANFGHEMADGQLLCHIQIVHVYIHVCILTYWYVRMCNCNGNCITTMCV